MASGALEAPAAKSWTAAIQERTESVRRTISARVAAVIPERDRPTVLAALIMGAQSAIPQDLQEAYRVSGLAHLLSISGVHMSILTVIVFFVVRRGLALSPTIALRLDTKKVAACAALCMATLYLLVSDMSVPTVRSYLMIGVVLAAILLDRTAISLRSVAWAALLLMAFYPDAVIGASFEMSFMAVIGAGGHCRARAVERVVVRARRRLSACPRVGPDRRGAGRHRHRRRRCDGAFAIYHFNRFATYSMIANLLAAPVTGLWVMPSAMIAMLIMPFGLAAWPLKAMAAGVDMVNGIARMGCGMARSAAPRTAHERRRPLHSWRLD